MMVADGEAQVRGPARVTTLMTTEPLDPAAGLRAVADPAAGGTCVFAGTVRDHADGRAVDALEYEVWEERATQVLDEVARDVVAAHPDVRVLYAVHRSGALEIGDVSVVVAASAAHRAEAFEAARALIDAVKERVPIWKRERFREGDARWVGDPGGGDGLRAQTPHATRPVR